MAEIFFSYNRLNSTFALQLAKDMRQYGLNVWIDQINITPGHRWDKTVETALQRCEIMLLILTKSSVESENVLDEVGFAIDKRKRIIPVLAEECELPFRIRRLQYIDFTKNYDRGLTGLLAEFGINRTPGDYELIDQGKSANRSIQRKRIISISLAILGIVAVIVAYPWITNNFKQTEQSSTVADSTISDSIPSLPDSNATRNIAPAEDSNLQLQTGKTDPTSIPQTIDTIGSSYHSVKQESESSPTDSTVELSMADKFKQKFVRTYSFVPTENQVMGYGKATISHIVGNTFECSVDIEGNRKKTQFPITINGTIKIRFEVVTEKGYGWTVNPHVITFYETNPMNKVIKKEVDLTIASSSVSSTVISNISLAKFELREDPKKNTIFFSINFQTDKPYYDDYIHSIPFGYK